MTRAPALRPSREALLTLLLMLAAVGQGQGQVEGGGGGRRAIPEPAEGETAGPDSDAAPAEDGEKPKPSKPAARAKGAPEGLISLSEIGRRTGISYPTLLRYVRLGDGLAAITVLVGVHLLALATEQFFVAVDRPFGEDAKSLRRRAMDAASFINGFRVAPGEQWGVPA